MTLPTRLTSSILRQRLSSPSPALLHTMSILPNASFVFWKADTCRHTTEVRSNCLCNSHVGSSFLAHSTELKLTVTSYSTPSFSLLALFKSKEASAWNSLVNSTFATPQHVITFRTHAHPQGNHVLGSRDG